MLRIGFDLDGVLADFASRFLEIKKRVVGAEAEVAADQPEEVNQPEEEFADSRETRQTIWREIQGTTNFWASLEPTDANAVRRIHELMLQHRWEVFFITRRPATEGDTVQRQSQHWLVKQGFDLPSVLVISGSRGAAASALRLDYHVDDDPQNCLDVITDSTARAILIIHESPGAQNARRLGIATAPSIGSCLDILEQASLSHNNPGLLRKLASLVGWK